VLIQRVEGGRAVNPILGRKLALLLLAGGLAISPAACTSSKASHPGGSVAGSVSPGQGAGRHGIPKSAFANLESFTGPAVTKYGLARVQAGYEEMVNFIFETGWNSALIAKSSALLSRADFTVAHSYMTPAFRKAFDATFAKVVQGDKVAIRKLEHAMFFGVTGPNGAKPVTNGHVVTDRRFSRATPAVDTSRGFDRLQLTFDARANIQLQDTAGKHYTLPATRVLRYWLVPNPSTVVLNRPFLIDSWEIRLKTGKPQTAK